MPEITGARLPPSCKFQSEQVVSPKSAQALARPSLPSPPFARRTQLHAADNFSGFFVRGARLAEGQTDGQTDRRTDAVEGSDSQSAEDEAAKNVTERDFASATTKCTRVQHSDDNSL